jgi:hypothetical protein
MADWRQIQARIRKAKTSPDAQSKLSELYQRTHDAMVAWELALIEEKAVRNDEAGRWYTIAAQRFRRAEWKKKAEEALTRLGFELPPPGAVEPGAEVHNAADGHGEATRERLAHGEVTEEIPAAAPLESHTETAVAAEADDGAKKKRRRGRRGGRGRRRKGSGAAPGLPTQAFAQSSAPAQPPPRAQAPRAASFERAHVAAPPVAYSPPESPRHAAVEPPAPMLPSERTAHGRAGDPALASRLAHLESMLRRLISGTLHRLEESDEAPAGPGVFLLSDSDLITSYYVEACQTLRVGLGNLARGGRAGKSSRGSRGPSESGLKAKLAEHLEISEAKVGQYLKDHCVVRWIQLDDDAALLAHFAIGVLRTPLNLD